MLVPLSFHCSSRRNLVKFGGGETSGINIICIPVELLIFGLPWLDLVEIAAEVAVGGVESVAKVGMPKKCGNGDGRDRRWLHRAFGEDEASAWIRVRRCAVGYHGEEDGAHGCNGLFGSSRIPSSVGGDHRGTARCSRCGGSCRSRSRDRRLGRRQWGHVCCVELLSMEKKDVAPTM